MKFDIVQVKAWVVSAIISIALNAKAFELQTLPVMIVNILICALIPGWFIYLVEKIRGNKQKIDDMSAIPRELGVWGYVWRIKVIECLSMVFVVVAFLFVITSPPAQSIVASLISTVALLLLAPIVTWAVFSRNRKEQMKWVVQSLRGY